MNFRKTILVGSLALISMNALAVTAIAPANRIRIWEGSSSSFPDTQYSIGTSPSLGTIKTLKSNPTVINLLTNLNVASNAGGLDMSRAPGARLTSEPFNNGLHQRLSDVGIPTGQCVAFARSMTGTTASTTWYKGKALMDYVYWNGAGYVLNNSVPALQSGTMIAHFQGLAKYPVSEPYGHVAIFLSWSRNAQGWIDGINVVDENLVWTIGGNTGSAAGLIQKHKIPFNSGSSNVTYNSSGYNVVDVR